MLTKLITYDICEEIFIHFFNGESQVFQLLNIKRQLDPTYY